MSMPIAQTASILIDKQIVDTDADGNDWNDANENGRAEAGETIEYSFDITDNDNGTLYNVTLSDPDVTTSDLVGLTDEDGDRAADDLAVGATATATGSYELEQSDIDAGQFVNIADADAVGPDGDPVNDDDTETATLPQNGSILVLKVCTVDPVPQEGPAEYQVTVLNNGNVTIYDLAVMDEQVANLNLVSGDTDNDGELDVGETWTYTGSIVGPFSGQETVDNTASASGTYSDVAGITNTVNGSDSAICTVGGRVNVEKTTIFQDVPNDTYTWTFGICEGPNELGSSEFLASPLATDSTNPDTGDTSLDFGNLNLDPAKTYTLCELEVPAGWGTFWRIDTKNDGITDTTVIAYNPNETDDPPGDLDNRCYDFTVGTGNTLAVDIENNYPGGDPRTPGYWKNWNRATSVSQAVKGQDAVVCALGAGNDLKKTTVRTTGTINIISGMQKNNVKRLMVITAMGVGDSWDDLSLYNKFFFATLLKSSRTDHETQESAVKESDLDWTIIRPSGLTDDPRTGVYEVGENIPAITSKITRADVANLILKELEQNALIGRAVTITN